MNEKQMIDFIERNVTTQGNEGAINLSPLLLAMVEMLFKEPLTGITPIVVNIEEVGENKGMRTIYQVTTPQDIINAYIASAFENKEKTRLFVEDNGALIGFNFVEIDELTLSGKAVLADGEFGLVLNKDVGKSYFYHEERITAIPHVTLGEIDAYNMIFGAKYDKINDVYKLVVGATEFTLTPAEMIIVNEEYNKSSNDGTYTAMWANSIAKYICCPEWFDGFHSFRLHSSFKNSRKVIIIDLHTEMLSVSDLTSTFEGCERLEQIAGIIDVQPGTPLNNVFKGCKVLHTFNLHGLSNNLDLSDCAQLTAETISELVQYASDRAYITIYVHSDVNNNINNNASWRDVKAQIQNKKSVQILTR